MNPDPSRKRSFEDFLSRARRGRPETEAAVPYGLATAVVARWRETSDCSTRLLVLQLTRWGMACAMLISGTLFVTLHPAPREPQATALMELAGLLDESSTGSGE